MTSDHSMRVSGGIAAVPAEPAPPAKSAGRRLEWPTIWHRDQLPFPWGSAKRLRKERKAMPPSQPTHKP